MLQNDQSPVAVRLMVCVCEVGGREFTVDPFDLRLEGSLSLTHLRLKNQSSMYPSYLDILWSSIRKTVCTFGGNRNHRKVEVVWYLYSEEQNGKSYEETELKAKEHFCSSR